MKLPKDFYDRPTLDVAEGMIGKVLVRRLDDVRVAGVIVETEAYIGTTDLACHASKGRTKRTEVMFGEPGRTYVYLIYGFHHCLNAVTEARDFPAAVLIRAIEPLDGVDTMRRNRSRAVKDNDIGSGPGKLCQAMGIDRSINDISLSGTTLWVEDRNLEPGRIVASPRIGVEYAGEYRDRPWRFFVEDNPHISRHPMNRVNRVNRVHTKTPRRIRRKS